MNEEFDIELRELTPDNMSKGYVEWLNDNEVNKYLESRFVEHTYVSAKAFVEDMLSSKNNYLFGIFVKDKHIGNIKIGNIEPKHLRADIGLLISRDYWGKGVATKAISMSEDFAFASLKLNKLTAGIYGPNEYSTRAFLSNNWRTVGVFKDHALLEDTFCDCYIVEKLNPICGEARIAYDIRNNSSTYGFQ